MALGKAVRSRVNTLASHRANSTAPVFVDVKAINLNIGGDHFRERSERSMKAQRGRDQINQWRFIADFPITEQLCRADVAAPSMRFDPSPVVDALKDVLAIFVDFQFDHDQPSVVTQCQ